MIASALRAILLRIETRQFAGLLKRNEELRGCHAGQKAFLFATGASLAGMDLSKFNGHITISCNHIFRHPSFSKFDLKYYVAGVPFRPWRQLSPRFTNKDHDRFFIAVDSAFRSRSTVHLYHATIHQYLESRGLLRSLPRYYFLRKGPLNTGSVQAVDLAAPITFADGALTLMIALAMFMGCTEIYLFGCGYTYSPVQLFHFDDMMRYQAGLSKAEMEAVKKDFILSHPESDFKYIDEHGSFAYGDNIMTDFSFDPVKHRPGTDFYQTHRAIRSFTDLNNVRVFNVVPPGYTSPVYINAPTGFSAGLKGGKSGGNYE